MVSDVRLRMRVENITHKNEALRDGVDSPMIRMDTRRVNSECVSVCSVAGMGYIQSQSTINNKNFGGNTMNKILSNIKGDNAHIRFTTKNDTFIEIANLLKKTAFADSATIVYKCDLSKGTATEKKVDLRYNNINEQNFWKQYIAYWYLLEFKKMESDLESITEVIPFDDEEAALIELAKSRKADFEAAYKQYIPQLKLDEISVTVKVLVLCDRNAKDKAFPEFIREALRPVLVAISEYDKYEVGTKKYKESFDAVKKAIEENFCGKIWQEHNETIMPYVFHCDTRLALNVTKVAYEGLARNSDGRLAVAKTKPEGIIREIVYQCFEELQRKVAVQVIETATK